MAIPNDLPKGDEARAEDRRAARKDSPLDGSTSGTIGGGGRETGGPTPRGQAPETPSVDPDAAASGRLAPDPLEPTQDLDDLGPGPSDVSER
jgi:hypothetical protein